MIGILNHACKVVRPGHSFLRRMIDLLRCPHARRTGRRPARHVCLNRGFRSDLLWWTAFVVQWNIVAIVAPHDSCGAHVVISDTSGSWGCAAWSGREWFQLEWDNQSHHFGIAVKELIPIIIASVVWGESWKGHLVRCRCDNQAVVAALSSRSSTEANIMHMLRCLFFVEAHFQF